MTSSPARGTTSSSSLPSRSLLSRLRSPLQSKSRNFTDFYIQPDDPHRQYAPGDIISGSVIIKIIKPLRITHLVISLHGFAQVYKNPNSPGDVYKSYTATVGNGKGKKTGGYFGNGFVSLFEDEVVLCGEGRLGEGVYHFNFELEFPSKGLPSSIDFERGTISYMLTSTLTRPTTISPTTSDNKKVHFVDVIDVAAIPEPKPRIISLEPISRRTRTKPSRKKPQAQEGPRPSDKSESTQNGKRSELNSVAEESTVPESPAPSDDSFESRLSSGNASGTEYGVRSINATIDTSSTKDGRTALNGKTITTTIEVAKGGFLRGDQIPVRIFVEHTKHVRSLKGIIITLYRQARVDMHPALPLAPNSKGDKTKSEDYYPKSRTGLGGLSLSSAGSSHLFRKDLSQSFAPLFVDPRTLTADVKCAVRVPDEAFPSISNVPGAMISFKYFVEVVIDIQGKLSGLDRVVPNPNTTFVPLGSSVNQGRADDPTGSMYSTWGGNFTDTDAIRREKGVISCLFEVVIGTKDSERNGKRKEQPQEPSPETRSNIHDVSQQEADGAYGSGEYGDYYDYDQNGQYYDEYGYDNPYWNAPDYQAAAGTATQPPYNHSVHQAAEENISEKERIKRAETRLLPSQPPTDGEPSASTTPLTVPPSAPILPDDEYLGDIYHPTGAELSSSASASQPPPPSFGAPSSSSRPLTAVQAPQSTANYARHPPTIGSSSTAIANEHRSSPPLASTTTIPNSHPSIPPSQSSSIPDYFPSPFARVQPTDDKQELQRRRLEMEASAPPVDPPNEGAGGEGYASPGGPSAPPPPTSGMHHLMLAPSAPVLDEHDEGLVGAVRPSQERGAREAGAARSGVEALPEYER